MGKFEDALKTIEEATVPPTRPDRFEEFVEKFLQAYSQFFMFHWQTDTQGRHIAFGEVNDDLEEMMDKFVEAYQGKRGKVRISGTRPVFNFGEKDEVAFVEEYRDFLQGFRGALDDDDEDLEGVLDEMVSRMNKLLYLLSLKG